MHKFVLLARADARADTMKRARETDFGDDTTCVVCLSTTEEVVAASAATTADNGDAGGAQSCLGCGKRLHAECAEQWRQTARRPGCPHCRRAWAVAPGSAAANAQMPVSLEEFVQALHQFLEGAAGRAFVPPMTHDEVLRVVRQADGTVVLRTTEAGEVVAASARVTLGPLPPPQSHARHGHAMTTRSRAAAR